MTTDQYIPNGCSLFINKHHPVKRLAQWCLLSKCGQVQQQVCRCASQGNCSCYTANDLPALLSYSELNSNKGRLLVHTAHLQEHCWHVLKRRSRVVCVHWGYRACLAPAKIGQRSCRPGSGGAIREPRGAIDVPHPLGNRQFGSKGGGAGRSGEPS